MPTKKKNSVHRVLSRKKKTCSAICILDPIDYRTLRANPHTISFFIDTDNTTRDCKPTDDTRQCVKYSYVNTSQQCHLNNIKCSASYHNFFKYNDIFIHKASRQLQYRGRGQIPFTNVHWGQRKLFASELMFFLDALSVGQKYHIIYAGSACGTHLLLLIKMFPNYKYTLIDPAKFDKRLYLFKQVTIINDYFDSKLAHTLKKQNTGHKLIFISDIRTEPSEEAITKNMHDQEKWVHIMHPEHSLLKFRLPWQNVDKPYTYLQGKIYKQIWQPKTSTETRLWVKRPRKKTTRYASQTYSISDYENTLFYHNIITRSQNFSIHRDGKKKFPWHKLHMDNCFDCTVEKYIHNKYIKSKFNCLQLRNAFQLSLLLTNTLIATDAATCLENKWNKVQTNLEKL